MNNFIIMSLNRVFTIALNTKEGIIHFLIINANQ